MTSDLEAALREARELCESVRLLSHPIGAHAARLLARIDAVLSAASGEASGESEIERLTDKVEGLGCDLDNALDVLWRRGDAGAREWIRLNYRLKHAQMLHAEIAARPAPSEAPNVERVRALVAQILEVPEGSVSKSSPGFRSAVAALDAARVDGEIIGERRQSGVTAPLLYSNKMEIDQLRGRIAELEKADAEWAKAGTRWAQETSALKDRIAELEALVDVDQMQQLRQQEIDGISASARAKGIAEERNRCAKVLLTSKRAAFTGAAEHAGTYWDGWDGACETLAAQAVTEIFVFGSNLAGRHGKGAALEALKRHGARYGRGEGLQGSSYAIPTKDGRLQSLSLSEIERHVLTFLSFAAAFSTETFRLTPIGCGLAGYSPKQIAPMFKGSPPNVILPDEFKVALEAKP